MIEPLQAIASGRLQRGFSIKSLNNAQVRAGGPLLALDERFRPLPQGGGIGRLFETAANELR